MLISRELENLNQEFGLHELVEQAARLIQLFVSKQEKYKVTDYPDPRTVRFYLTRGLMDKPHRYDGQKAIFSSKHLLQLIVIKYYQSQHFSIKQIREMINGLSYDDLINIIPNHRGKDNNATYLKRLSQNTKILNLELCKDKITKNSSEETLWNHYVIESGFEIHIKRDFLPKGSSHIEILTNRIKILLKTSIKALEVSYVNSRDPS
jgi:DNA-binding transcriptional MerR regulator